MCIRAIRDGDGVFRLAVYPHHFIKTSSTQRAVFAIHNLMRITEDPSDGSYHTSLGWEEYLPTTEYVHAYGCRNALGQNTRLKERGKYKEKDRRVYCGAYRFLAWAIRDLPLAEGASGITSAEVAQRTEDGEMAHVDLRFILNPDVDVETSKTAIVRLLWAAARGPLKHICECDTDLNPHPNVHLTIPPLGECS